jgi:hypothetical protein
MVELAALVAVVSIAALARITVDASPYLFYWRIVVAAFVVVASAWAIGSWWPVSAHPRARAVAAGALVIALLVGFGGQIADVVNHSDEVAATEASTESLMHQIERSGLPDHPVLVRNLGNNVGGVQQGLIDALDRADAPVRMDPQFAYRFAPRLAAETSEAGEVWYVTEEGIRTTLLPDRPGARVVASTSPLSAVHERELRRLQHDAAASLAAAGASDRIPQLDSPFLVQFDAGDPLPGVSAAAIHRVAELNRRVRDSGTCRCSVVAFPSSAPEVEGVSG